MLKHGNVHLFLNVYFIMSNDFRNKYESSRVY